MNEERYTRNFPSISEDEQKILAQKTVAVVGCGGLGGHVIDALARVGIGRLVLIDCDVFSKSNLNRQLISKESNLGKSKAKEAAKRVSEINSEVKTIAVEELLTEENAEDILKEADIVVDALDNIKTRFMVQDACEKLGIYLIHGAVAGWRAQASTIAPGSKGFDKFYPKDSNPKPPSVLSFAPDFAASIEVAETLKVLLGRGETLENKLLVADLLNMSIDIIELG